MELGLKVLVLLAFAFTFVLGEDGGDDDTVYCDCPANTYVNVDDFIYVRRFEFFFWNLFEICNVFFLVFEWLLIHPLLDRTSRKQ